MKPFKMNPFEGNFSLKILQLHNQMSQVWWFYSTGICFFDQKCYHWKYCVERCTVMMKNSLCLDKDVFFLMSILLLTLWNLKVEWFIYCFTEWIGSEWCFGIEKVNQHGFLFFDFDIYNVLVSETEIFILRFWHSVSVLLKDPSIIKSHHFPKC
jgi:hypothetical protein